MSLVFRFLTGRSAPEPLNNAELHFTSIAFGDFYKNEVITSNSSQEL